MYDWSAFLPKLFERVESILQFHQFKFFPDGTLLTRRFISDEYGAPVYLRRKLPREIDPTLMPSVVPHEGLSAQRQWYLYDNIREFCKETCRDEMCPKPSVPKPGGML